MSGYGSAHRLANSLRIANASLLAEIKARAALVAHAQGLHELCSYPLRGSVNNVRIADIMYGWPPAGLNSLRNAGVTPLLEQIAAAVSPATLRKKKFGGRLLLSVFVPGRDRPAAQGRRPPRSKPLRPALLRPAQPSAESNPVVSSVTPPPAPPALPAPPPAPPALPAPPAPPPAPPALPAPQPLSEFKKKKKAWLEKTVDTDLYSLYK